MSLLWRFRRVCPNGRLEVSCRVCENLFWLTEPELRSWVLCPHCVGFWRLPPDLMRQSEDEIGPARLESPGPRTTRSAPDDQTAA